MNCQINKTVEGTVIRFAVSLELPGGVTMDDVDFSVAFYIRPNMKKTYAKNEMVRQDSNLYIVNLDTSYMGCGRIMYQVNVSLPDGGREIISGRTDEALSAQILQ